MDPGQNNFGANRTAGVAGIAQQAISYLTTSVKSIFSKGKFSQELNGTWLQQPAKNTVAKADTGRNTDPPVRTTVTGKPGETAMATAAASVPTTPLLAGASVASINNVQDPAQAAYAASISSSIAANSITSVNNATLVPPGLPTQDPAIQVENPVPAPPVLGGGYVYGNGTNTPVASSNPTQGIVNDDQGGPR
jgi:uncharacterized protein with beta-barrel porin domain